MKKLALLALASLGMLTGATSFAWAHTPIIIEPTIYPVRMVRVWVPSVYRTAYETIWIDGCYQTVEERVWVQPVYGWRTIVRPNDMEERVWCIINPGHWETRCRQVWVPAHEESITRQILVTPGHWEWIQEPIPMPYPEPLPPEPRPYQTNPPKVGVDGYKSGDSANPESVFTPLQEWPK